MIEPVERKVLTPIRCQPRSLRRGRWHVDAKELDETVGKA
jgi:hypothetical protein